MIARTPELKAALVELSKNWENLAISLEDIQGVLGEIEVVPSEIDQAVNDTVPLSKLPDLAK